MKKLMTMVSAMMMVAAVNASEVATVAFNEARVNVPARVRFVKGENYGFSVEAKDSVIARAVRCSVKDGVLRLSFGNALKPGDPNSMPRRACITTVSIRPIMSL